MDRFGWLGHDDNDPRRTKVQGATDPETIRPGGRVQDPGIDRRADVAPGRRRQDALRLAAAWRSRQPRQITRDANTDVHPTAAVDSGTVAAHRRGCRRADVPPSQTVQAPGDS